MSQQDIWSPQNREVDFMRAGYSFRIILKHFKIYHYFVKRKQPTKIIFLKLFFLGKIIYWKYIIIFAERKKKLHRNLKNGRIDCKVPRKKNFF